jgi:hypothetical protein
MDAHDAKKRNLEEQARMPRDVGYAGAGRLGLDNVEQRLAQVLPLLRGRDVQLQPWLRAGRLRTRRRRAR